MRIRAAVLTAPNRPLEVVDLELEPPRRDEVLVRLLAATASATATSPTSTASGRCRCRSCSATRAARSIEDVGEGVDPARIGDRVVLTFSPACGALPLLPRGPREPMPRRRRRSRRRAPARRHARRLSRDGAPVHHLAFVSSFASHAVVPADGARSRSTPSSISTLACLLGCGVTTGVMSVTRRANVRPGEAVADPRLRRRRAVRRDRARSSSRAAPDRRRRSAGGEARARARGSARPMCSIPAGRHPSQQVREIVPGGVDAPFVALGVQGVAEQAFRCTRAGGTTVLIGQPSMSTAMRLHVYDATQFEHTVLGSNLGRRGAGAARARAGPPRGRGRAPARAAGDPPVPARADRGGGGDDRERPGRPRWSSVTDRVLTAPGPATSIARNRLGAQDSPALIDKEMRPA